jgi:hypothetical protein
MNGQAVAGKAVRKNFHNTLGVRLAFATDDEIVGEANQKDASCHAGLNRGAKPLVQHIVQVDVGC